MPDLTSGQIRFDGLASGMDFDEIVQQMVSIEGRKIQRMQQDLQMEQAKMDATQEIRNSTVSLRSEMDEMSTMNDFLIKDATSDNESTATVTADSDAEEGSYHLEVNQLAQNNIMYHDQGYDELDDPVNEEGEERVFAYEYGDEEVEVAVPDGTTLEGLVERINEDPDNPGIRASTIFDGDQYYLQLKGMDQGADYNITIDDENTTLPDFEPENFSDTQEAQNSQIKIDGWPEEEEHWIERDTNSIDDVIEGLTLNLHSTGETRIEVSEDQEAIKEQVYSFVESINKVLAQIQHATGVDEEEDDDTQDTEDEEDEVEVEDGPQASILTGNYGIRNVQQQIRSTLAAAGVGFDRQEDLFPSLSNVGIETETDEDSEDFGLLTIDEAALDEALEEDSQAVAEIFSADNVPETDTADFRFASQVEGTTEPGVYGVEYDVDADGNIENAFIDGYQAEIDNEENTISAVEGPARGLAIQVDNLQENGYEGNIRLKQGKAGELADTLGQMISPDTGKGTFQIMQEGYESSIESTENRIESEQERLQRYERRLTQKFARTEEMLSRYQGMQQSLQGQLQQMS